MSEVQALETTLKKLKNSGYFFVAVLVANAGMMYQQNKDNVESQRAVNVAQITTNQQVAQAINELQGSNKELRALVMGQDRRLQLLEARK